MKIDTSQIEMSASHFAVEQRNVRERLRVWTRSGPGAGVAEGPELKSPAAASRLVSDLPLPDVSRLSSSSNVLISPAAHQRAASALDLETPSVDIDPMLTLLRAMLYRVFGIEIEVFDPAELAVPAEGRSEAEPHNFQKNRGDAARASLPAGLGVEYERHEVRSEHEQMQFQATGVVQTTDGKRIAFELSIEMSRSFTERTEVSMRLGDAARKKDPLVINFAGTAAQLSSQTFRMDLDADGKIDQAHFVAAGSGFLVFDRNGNGRIDQASELFGPRTGDGFGELAALDSDGNGWIDENDADFGRLQVWTREGTANSAGVDRLRSLLDAHVGAIALARLETPFSIKDGRNAMLGEVRSSGVFLREDGRAGTIQQIDLAV